MINVGEFRAGPHRFPLDQVYLMGILNVTDDSFSGDGLTSTEAVLQKARQLLADGADLLDVGGETARTNRPAISEQKEIARIVPVIERLGSELAGLPISVNTWRSGVAKAGLAAGASILNDMSGLAAPDNARVAAQAQAGLVIMHLRGEPKQAHTRETYENVVAEVEDFFRQRIVLAEEHGLNRQNLLLDPGLDFAKQRADNLNILRGLNRLSGLGAPLLLADSRKTFLGELTGRPPAERDWGTLAASLWAVEQGIRFLRVHNVGIHKDALKVREAVLPCSNPAT